MGEVLHLVSRTSSIPLSPDGLPFTLPQLPLPSILLCPSALPRLLPTFIIYRMLMLDLYST